MAARGSAMGFSVWVPLGIVVAVVTTLGLLTGMAYSLGRVSGKKSSAITVVSSGPTITQLQSLGDLVVLKVSVADVLTGEGKGYKGAWLVKGDALVAVDLRQARVIRSDEHSRTLVVALPRPRVIQPRVDHDKTRSYKFGPTITLNPFASGDALLNTVMKEAQHMVTYACNNKAVLEQAEYNTNLLLVNMYRFIDWQVEVQWQSAGETPDATDEQDNGESASLKAAATAVRGQERFGD